ncbi:hypothetical protein MED121_02340 [Marinomonas sp. MED121]|uniref:glycosyltransferase family 2 protein n=1 Tax=Marinomonas sp. MED121 TaxID=314277 RepID=UPI0000690B13|nr:glycosyltransferase [Marinomonas sp. MED121]EAQ66013.1 hypothetical protein MED121_02340 [Marinomonas sp. MED121]
MNISIGILTYGRDEYFFDTINCLLKIKHKIEIIVLNNNENENGIKNKIENSLPANIRLKYIWHGKNYGVSTGRKMLVDNTSAEVMILLDDDIYVENPNEMICFVNTEFEQDLLLGGIAFNIVEYGKNRRNRYEIPHKNKLFDQNKKQPTYLMIGAGHAIDIEKSKSVFSYPTDFDLYGFEEVYLSFKLLNNGYNIIYLPGCKIEHRKSPDGRFENKKVNFLAYRNRMKIAAKHLKLRYLVSCFLVRTIYFLLKNKSISDVIKVAKESYNDFIYHRKPFTSTFYKKIKRLNGFLWY